MLVSSPLHMVFLLSGLVFLWRQCITVIVRMLLISLSCNTNATAILRMAYLCFSLWCLLYSEKL